MIMKNKDKARNLLTSNLPEFVAGTEIMMEDELGNFPQNYLLVEYQKSLKLAQPWLTDSCHPPMFSISSQSVECQECEDVIKDFPDILKCRRKVSSQTVFSCQRYKRYYCRCRPGTSFTGKPMSLCSICTGKQRDGPHIPIGRQCDLSFTHACDLLKHNKGHNLNYEGRGLVRICLRVHENRGELYNDSEIKVDLKKILKADQNVILVDPKYGKEDIPDDSVERYVTYIDLIVKDKIDAKEYF